MLWFFAILFVFIFSVSIITFMYALIASSVMSRGVTNKRYMDEEDDARTYVQMPDGEVRFD